MTTLTHNERRHLQEVFSTISDVKPARFPRMKKLLIVIRFFLASLGRKRA